MTDNAYDSYREMWRDLENENQCLKAKLEALYQAVTKASYVCPFTSPASPFLNEAKMILDGFDLETARREAHS